MSFGQSEVASPKRLTVSGSIGDSGKAVDVLGYSILSGSTAGNIFFFSGTGTGASGIFEWSDQAKGVSAEQTISLAYPIRLSAGGYVSFDANVTAACIFYRQVMGQ